MIYPVIDLDIVYEDEDVLIVNKPAGIVISKGEASGCYTCRIYTWLFTEKGEWSPKDSLKPGICNRLDRNTVVL